MVLALMLKNVTKITHAEIRLFENTLYRSKSEKTKYEVVSMAIQSLQLGNQTVDGAVVPTNNNPEFVDRSDMLFSYMNMIAFNNKVDLKLP